MMRAVSFTSSAGLTLRGVLHYPDEATGVASPEAAILLPGLIGNRVGPHRLLFDLAELLARGGLPVLRCDPSGCGYSDGPPGGVPFDALIHDARDMMDFLRKRLGAETFLLGGICRGAKIALAAALDEPRVRHLALLSCAPLREAALGAKMRRRRLSHLKRYGRTFLTFRWIPRLLAGDLNFPLIGNAIAHPVNRAAVGDMSIPDDALTPQRFPARALFLYGENDPDHDVAQRYYAEKLAPAENQVVFRTIPESDTGFYSVSWTDSALEVVENWWKGPGQAETRSRAR